MYLLTALRPRSNVNLILQIKCINFPFEMKHFFAAIHSQKCLCKMDSEEQEMLLNTCMNSLHYLLVLHFLCIAIELQVERVLAFAAHLFFLLKQKKR